MARGFHFLLTGINLTISLSDGFILGTGFPRFCYHNWTILETIKVNNTLVFSKNDHWYLQNINGNYLTSILFDSDWYDLAEILLVSL